jgi:hypothetical protein
MQSREEAIAALVSEWVRKADLDFQTVVRLVAEEHLSRYRRLSRPAGRGEISEGSPHEASDGISQDARNSPLA